MSRFFFAKKELLTVSYMVTCNGDRIVCTNYDFESQSVLRSRAACHENLVRMRLVSYGLVAAVAFAGVCATGLTCVAYVACNKTCVVPITKKTPLPQSPISPILQYSVDRDSQRDLEINDPEINNVVTMIIKRYLAIMRSPEQDKRRILLENGFMLFTEDVFCHEKLPGFVIKLGNVFDRMVGLRILESILARTTNSRVLVPKKKILHISLYGAGSDTDVLIAQKFDYVSDRELMRYLEGHRDIWAQLLDVLRESGYCDAHFGNIKLTRAGYVVILDTEFGDFGVPGRYCDYAEDLYEKFMGRVSKGPKRTCVQHGMRHMLKRTALPLVTRNSQHN